MPCLFAVTDARFLHEYILDRKSARSWHSLMVSDSRTSYLLQWAAPLRRTSRMASLSSSSFDAIIS